jgi:uncharacterized membrane protein
MEFNALARAVPLLGFLAAIFAAVFWMVVGWRAMRAHERLAEAAEQIAGRSAEGLRL